MLRLLIFVIASLKFASTQQFLTFFGTGSDDKDYIPVFKCLLSEKLFKGSLFQHLIVIERQYVWQGATPAELYKIYPQPIHALLTIYEYDEDRSHFADMLASALKDQPIKTVWIFVSDFIHSCDELKEYISILSKILTRDQSFGILTGPQQWQKTFRREDGCPQVPKIAPLFYASQFQYFIPFGGWTKAEYIFGGEIYIPQCKIGSSATFTSYSERQ